MLHRGAFTHKITKAFTQISPYTAEVLHTDALKHKLLNKAAFTYTEQLLHRETFTERSLYTEKFLHTEAFTQRSLYT